MAKDYSRSDRVGQQVLRELPDIIRHELKDPRIGMRGRKKERKKEGEYDFVMNDLETYNYIVMCGIHRLLVSVAITHNL